MDEREDEMGNLVEEKKKIKFKEIFIGILLIVSLVILGLFVNYPYPSKSLLEVVQPETKSINFTPIPCWVVCANNSTGGYNDMENNS